MDNRRSFIKKIRFISGSKHTAFSQAIFSKPPRKLGVALLGLGGYSTTQLAPALQKTEHIELRGIVTGSPEKIPQWKNKYNIKDANVYNYENMGNIADNDAIDVVYIVTPTFLHAKYAMAAANAGKHVFCEKPMAMTAAECQQIIDACKENNVKLAIGYRMQHEKNTRQIINWADTKPYGAIQKVDTASGFTINKSAGWRLDGAKGGGAIYDMGVYNINGVRYATGLEPLWVKARHETTRPGTF